MISLQWMLVLTLVSFAAATVPSGLYPQIPSVKSFTQTSDGASFSLKSETQIIVDSNHAGDGSPSLLTFAQRFREDLISVSGFTTLPEVTSGSASSSSSIFLTTGASGHTLFNGKSTPEGYDFSVTSTEYRINGASPLGVWWGTRSLLQQLSRSSDKTFLSGSGSDTPGFEVRGWHLDAGRHYFTTEFLTELCIYASFYKLNTFHIHASDNLWNAAFLYGKDWQKLYSGFRFRPQDGSPISGIVGSLGNETWSQDEWTSMQTTCSEHGVTLIAEIDTPGHSLGITKWKPELAISGKPDLLNLSHPDTIPTIKSLWDEILPWLSSTEVHIGADEYDSSLANDYIDFVNEMNDYFKQKSGKSMRVWGTNEPSETKSVATDVTIQHWNFPADSVPVKLMEKGYNVINSEQKFLYLDGKTSDSAQFPYELDQDLLWGGINGKGWAPNVFSKDDSSNNTSIDNPHLRGSIMAMWNDWGGNSSTPLEIYYQFARSFAVFAEKTWAGSEARDTALTRSEFNAAYPIYNQAAPGQNLNRRQGVTTQHDNVVFEYSGSVPPGTQTSFSSVGPPYTLSFSVKPSTTTQMSVPLSDGGSIMVPFNGGAIFSGKDSKLLVSSLTFQDPATNRFYAISDYELPTDRYTTIEIQATNLTTTATITDSNGGSSKKVTWKSNLDMWGESMKEVDMSFAAPSWVIGADGFDGDIKDVKLTIDRQLV